MDENLRLTFLQKGTSKQIVQADIVPYMRSLFFPVNKKEKFLEKEKLNWKQLLVINKKQSVLFKQEEINKVENEQKGNFYSTNLADQEKLDEDSAGGNAVGGDSDKDLPILMNKRKILKAKIAKAKTLYRLLSAFGKNDEEEKRQLKVQVELIKAQEYELER